MTKQKHGENLGISRGENKRSKLYQVWCGMRARCRDPKHISYKNYGKRGIKVDPRWDDYTAFRDWSYENGYVDPPPGVRSKLWIDRIDSDGHYSPENCQWITAQENVRKTQKTIIAFGEHKTLVEWSEDDRCVVTYYVLRNRNNRGWDFERALSTPANPPGVWHQPRK